MTTLYQERLALFADNSRQTNKLFKWRSVQVNRLAALLFALEDRAVEGDELHNSYALIKDSTGPFSMFRGNSAISISALLSLTQDPKHILTQTMEVYDLMKEIKFRTSDYLVVAAYQIAAHTQPDQYKYTVERAKAFYDRMKQSRRFQTSQDDYIFASMLALSGADVESCGNRMDRLYEALKPQLPFRSGNSIQALTQVLALGESDETTSVSRVLELRDIFREQGLRMDKEYTLPSLGILSLLPSEIESITTDIVESYNYLRTEKGFSGWSITQPELLLLCAALVASEHLKNARGGTLLTTAAATSITNIVIAQQTALAMAAAIAASSAASSSSN